MTAFLSIVAVGLGTYLSRAVLILSLADRQLPATVRVALRFVAPAVLSALVVALLIDTQGQVALDLPELLAFLLAGSVAYRTKNHVYTLVVGMAVYWLTSTYV